MPSKLDHYKSYLEDRLNRAVPHVLPATVLLKRNTATEGYQGKLTILREFLRNLRTAEPEKVIRYETEPGQQMQVDWWKVTQR